MCVRGAALRLEFCFESVLRKPRGRHRQFFVILGRKNACFWTAGWPPGGLGGPWTASRAFQGYISTDGKRLKNGPFFAVPAGGGGRKTHAGGRL